MKVLLSFILMVAVVVLTIVGLGAIVSWAWNQIADSFSLNHASLWAGVGVVTLLIIFASFIQGTKKT